VSNVIRLVRDTMMGLFPSTRAAFLAGKRHAVSEALRSVSLVMTRQSVIYERHDDPKAFHAIEETQGLVRQHLEAVYEAYDADAKAAS
jgi:hypothetical protein